VEIQRHQIAFIDDDPECVVFVFSGRLHNTKAPLNAHVGGRVVDGIMTLAVAIIRGSKPDKEKPGGTMMVGAANY